MDKTNERLTRLEEHITLMVVRHQDAVETEAVRLKEFDLLTERLVKVEELLKETGKP